MYTLALKPVFFKRAIHIVDFIPEENEGERMILKCF